MPASAASAADAAGLVRFAHLSADTPAVDVALAPLPAGGGPPLTDPGQDVASGLRYGDVSPYATVPPGRYAVSIRAAGTPRSAPPRLSVSLDIPSGGARTVALGGPFAELSLRVLTDDLAAPPDGAATVRVLSASSAASPVDVRLAGGPVLATGLPPGEAGDPVDVPAGPAAVTVTAGPTVPIDLRPGSVDTLLVLDAPGGGTTVRVVLDAAGPALRPVGAVEAGEGGAAGARSAPSVAEGAAAAVQEAPVRRPDVTAGAVRLAVPAAGIDTALTAIDLDATGSLVPPADDSVAGWYRSGPRPGDVGPAVIAGHVDSTAGPAVFFRLRQVTVGDEITVTHPGGSAVRFTVTRVERYPKAAFPAAEVYAPTPGPELRLITCGGAFDRAARSYVDDVVVYAALR